jgi:hypothetical protein
VVSRVTIDDKAIQGSLRRLSRHISDTPVIMRVLGLALRNYVRQTIDMGGRKRAHAPLSWWTQQRTGRRKPLRGISKDIHYNSDAREANVYFARQTIGWSLDMHHKGYNVPAITGQLQKVPLAKGGAIFFRNRRASKVVRDLTSRTVTEWIEDGAKKSWRP